MQFQLFRNLETLKNKITYAHRYNLTVHSFQTISLVTQDFCIVQIMALLKIDKRMVNAKIDYLISASKFTCNIICHKHFTGTTSLTETCNILPISKSNEFLGILYL